MKKTAWWTMKSSLILLIIFTTPCRADLDSMISVNVRNAPLRGVLDTIATKAGLKLVADQDLSSSVTIAQNNVSARQVLEKLALESGIDYSINGDNLLVSKSKGGNFTSESSSGDTHEIILHYANASELLTKFATVIGSDGKLIIDELSNKLIYIGSTKTYSKLLNLVKFFDSPQKQIMIEALIVETSHSFMQSLGISLGFMGNTSTNAGPKVPNGSFQAVGNVNGRALDMKLTTAENNGDAKIISRPKVVTLNNRAAQINSGITYHVKTLSNVVISSGGNQAAATGGVTSIGAGLTLKIIPTLVNGEQIKLAVDINDSQPDNGTAVDGIPGIVQNSANTTVIVGNKQTAVIAGLIKKDKSTNSDGIPILSDIPLLGLLFKSHSKKDINNELAIFLTPTIGDPENVSPTEMAVLKKASEDIERATAVAAVEDLTKDKVKEPVKEKEKRAPAASSDDEEDDE